MLYVRVDGKLELYFKGIRSLLFCLYTLATFKEGNVLLIH